MAVKKQSVATLCSFALILWGYQTGLWAIAVSLTLMLEGRSFIRWRGQTSQEYLQVLHVSVALLWIVTVVALPVSQSVPYAARHQVLQGLPIALFPLILAHTYSTNFLSHYGSVFLDRHGNERTINLYVLYLGVCLIAASVTGGHPWVFGAVAILLILGLLLTYRSSRYQPLTLLGLIIGAWAMSVLASTQLSWFHANVSLPNPISLVSRSIAGFIDRTVSDVATDVAIDVNWPEPPPVPDFEGLEFETGTETIEQESRRSDSRAQDNRQRRQSSRDASRADDVETTFPNASDSDLEGEAGGLPSSNGAENSFESAIASSLGDSGVSRSLPPRSSGSQQNPSRSTDDTVPWGTQGTPSLAQVRQQLASVVDPNQSKTRIGSLGALQQSKAVLFRVKPEANVNQISLPIYMREATYNTYQQGAWNLADPSSSSVSLQNGTWQLGQDNGANIALTVSDLQQRSGGLLKLPMGTTEVTNLPFNRLQVNPYGTAIVKANSPQTLSYRLRFNPRASLDAAPDSGDLAVPAVERPVLRQILNDLSLDGQSEGEKVRAIERFFQQGFVYSLQLLPPEPGKTPIASFLTTRRSGHCEYYASATTLLLREAGIPARYTVGYSVSERDADGFVVRLSNAHAWVTAYVNGAWRIVETTPGSGATQLEDSLGDAQAFEQAVVEQIVQEHQGQAGLASGESLSVEEVIRSAEESPGALDSESQEHLWEAIWQDLRARWSELWTGWTQWIGSNAWFAAFLAFAIAIAVGAGIIIGRLLRLKRPHLPRSWRKRTKAISPIGFHEIEEYLESLNLGRSASETPKRWTLRLAKTLPVSQVEALQVILDLHYRDRFDPEGLSEEEKAEFLARIEAWLEEARLKPSKQLV